LAGGSRHLHGTQTLNKHANVSATHNNINGWLWPLHHIIFSDLKKTFKENFNYQKRSLAEPCKASAVDYLTQELVSLGVKHHVTASAGV